jgi:hypothetical protein
MRMLRDLKLVLFGWQSFERMCYIDAAQVKEPCASENLSKVEKPISKVKPKRVSALKFASHLFG